MLRQHLPRIRVPLVNGDPDIVLDLQAVLNHCYDRGAYARRLDYRRDPTLHCKERMLGGPISCCATGSCARETAVPSAASRQSVRRSAPVAPSNQYASRWHPHAGTLPLTGLSFLILAVSADVPPGRDARSRG